MPIDVYLPYGVVFKAHFFTDAYSASVTTLRDGEKLDPVTNEPIIIVGPLLNAEGTSPSNFHNTPPINTGTGTNVQGHRYILKVEHYRNKAWKENRYKNFGGGGAMLTKIGTEDMPKGDPGEDWNDVMVEFKK